MENPGIIDIEGREFDDLEEFNIACFEDWGGLMCQDEEEGCLSAGADGFEGYTKFRVCMEEGKYYIKCEHGHFLSIRPSYEFGHLNCWDNKPEEEDQIVYLEPNEQFHSLFRFKTKAGKYLYCEWIKSSHGTLLIDDDSEGGTLFYLRSVQNVE
ncbi:hypothetical protein TRVA0_002S00276 [Trichomonascus vanleenenianus]|uniref:uncharacterized protein n=1 Tax=Trichomonascus vanleenenianus TaxID=2268995 RepID=UPI003ECA2E80